MSYPVFGHEYVTTIKVGEKEVKMTIGKFSEQASAAVLAQCGDTVVHTTAAMGSVSNLGYFPLSVDFAEKLYAGGIIKGSRWVKRDGRPTDEAILKSRVIDRTIRPLFPEGFMREVQVVNTVFSYDKQNDDGVVGMLATGLAMTLSDIPFDGPMAGLRVGYYKNTDEFILNPTEEERETSDLDLIVGGTAKAIAMVEAGGNEVSEEVMVKALDLAQKTISDICQQFTKIAAEIGREKIVWEDNTESFAAKRAIIEPFLREVMDVREVVEKEARFEAVDLSKEKEQVLEKIQEKLAQTIPTEEEVQEINNADINNVLSELIHEAVREMILEDGQRPDGRKVDEIRPIICEVDIFPRTHGSAMFKRGATQAVTITTLAPPALGQYVEDMGGEEVHHYMHHYNMPPFASGDAGRLGSPKRREIGHGALAQRALLPMLPAHEEFPYTIHVVSEILSSNGSTSQAAVCGSTLSLMAAGVPIRRPVAGIAMGLVAAEAIADGSTKYQILSDIKDVEDHCGDMDFKVAGSAQGITALQMDIKVKGISTKILTEALAKAKTARLFILDKMLEIISEPRKELSVYAPKIQQLVIPAGKIGELIGPGGKNIKRLIEQFEVQIDVDEDEEKQVGNVNVSGTDLEAIERCVKYIAGMMHEAAVGEEYEAVVTRVESYGAFAEYLPSQEGLIHVSAMSTDYVRDASDIVKLGDKVHIRVSGIQDDGKIKLSMLTLEQEEEVAASRNARPPRQQSGFRGSRPNGNGRPNGSGRPFRPRR
ncbi:polyribonucleotide nucleotidyltransferase [Microgenomates group bacterium]|nr:polyribonucleotide nucleotidyltransferase [Microgenomates group bacterium]